MPHGLLSLPALVAAILLGAAAWLLLRDALAAVGAAVATYVVMVLLERLR
jgi:hypothetical protein